MDEDDKNVDVLFRRSGTQWPGTKTFIKNAFETCLVVCTRIRHHEYGIEPLVNGLTGKDKSWLADFCQVGGKLRRLALTAPIVNDPDQTLLVE